MDVDGQHRALVEESPRIADMMEPEAIACVLDSNTGCHGDKTMGRGLLLWLLGVPIPVIILLWLFFGR
jgi:hypothetical protein